VEMIKVKHVGFQGKLPKQRIPLHEAQRYQAELFLQSSALVYHPIVTAINTKVHEQTHSWKLLLSLYFLLHFPPMFIQCTLSEIIMYMTKKRGDAWSQFFIGPNYQQP